MYNNGIAPLGMGVGAGVALPFLEMSPLWAALATFALIACASAVNRILPRVIVEGQDWPGPKQRNRG
jgi:putative flippase GtrA